MALESLGEAWVDVHARVDKNFDEDIVSGVKKELKDADANIGKIGEDFGKTLSKGMEKEISTHGPDIGKSVEKAVGKEVVEVAPKWHYNVRGKDGRFIRRMVTDIEDEVGAAFAATSASFFGKISQGISDAIGAGFNVPGGSPLIGLLIPAVGALVGLVVGAIQAVNSLIAVISTIPALLAAIGLQAAVLFVAFKGVGTAIQGAFAATNARELNEAIKGLTPSAQLFVRQLLPLEGLFNKLKAQLQEGFFKSFGDVVPQLTKAFSFLTNGSLASLSTALGGLFRDLGLFFSSPTFVSFVQAVIPATVEFLKKFGPDLVVFLKGLVAFGETMLPFLSSLGQILGGTLFQLGTFFQKVADDPATQKWMNDMLTTFQSVIELVGALIQFVTVLFAQLDAAGGQKVLDEIVTDVQLITGLLASDFGQKALEGLVHIVILALQVTTGLILGFVLLLGLFEITAEFIKHGLIPAVAEFFTWIGTAIWHALDVAGQAVRDFVHFLGDAIVSAFQAVVNFFVRFWNSINDGKGKLLLAVAALPGQIKNAIGDLGNLLYNAGRSVLQSFINGFKSMFSSLANIGREAIHQVTQFFPGSPAEVGPLSGKGYSYYRGQNLVKDFSRGIESEGPSLASMSSEAVNNIVFGANSIRVGFEGALPTTQQAQTTGTGVATGIMGGLAARNVRLAVRTI
jgi:hypothetical protein